MWWKWKNVMKMVFLACFLIYIFYITMNVNIFNTFFDIILYTVYSRNHNFGIKTTKFYRNIIFFTWKKDKLFFSRNSSTCFPKTSFFALWSKVSDCVIFCVLSYVYITAGILWKIDYIAFVLDFHKLSGKKSYVSRLKTHIFH